MEEKLKQLNEQTEPEPSAEKARKHLQRAVEKQLEAARDLHNNETARASEKQQEAAGELRQARRQLAEEQKNGREKEASGNHGAGSETEAEQQKQQAQEQVTGQQSREASPLPETYGKESPEDIINEELQNKRSRSAGGKTGYKQVEKDW